MTTNELAQVLKAVLQSQPHDSFGTPEWIALIATIAAVATAIIAGYALVHARASAASARQSAAEAKTANGLAATANLLTEQIAKRTGVIELHQAWRGVNRFDPHKPVFPDAINAANALDLTSSLWNHDVLEKIILFQSYWKPFKDLFHILSKCEIVMPDGRRVCDMISPTINLTFKQMEEMELKGVTQTNLNRK